MELNFAARAWNFSKLPVGIGRGFTLLQAVSEAARIKIGIICQRIPGEANHNADTFKRIVKLRGNLCGVAFFI